MEINILIGEGFEGYLDASWLKSVVESVLSAQNAGSNVELSLVITGQEAVQQLNKIYRGKDEPTDVLAFSMFPAEQEPGTDFSPFVVPPDGVAHLGEVIISYHQAVIQAKERQHPVEREVTILIIHGVLHLLGYEHDKPDLEQQMRMKEEEILSRIERVDK